jgi:hypothetical protein
MPVAAGVLGHPGGVGGGSHGQALQKGRIGHKARQSEGGSGDRNHSKTPKATDHTPPRKNTSRNSDIAEIGS